MPRVVWRRPADARPHPAARPYWPAYELATGHALPPRARSPAIHGSPCRSLNEHVGDDHPPARLAPGAGPTDLGHHLQPVLRGAGRPGRLGGAEGRLAADHRRRPPPHGARPADLEAVPGVPARTRPDRQRPLVRDPQLAAEPGLLVQEP